MAINDNKSYLSYLNKLGDEYNNTYHRSIGKTPINGDYSGLSKEFETNPKARKFGDRVRIAEYKNIFSKGYTKN